MNCNSGDCGGCRICDEMAIKPDLRATWAFHIGLVAALLVVATVVLWALLG